MIISASRRTDIPAFYFEWFINRLREGYVLVRNPFNRHLISRIKLSNDVVDFIVFWTKDPLNMINKLDYFDKFNIPYYLLFTITPYKKDIEPNLSEKSRIIETFIKISERIGKTRVIWRYDPIFLTSIIDLDYHAQNFNYLASRLNGYTDKCIISFLTLYEKCKRNLKSVNLIDLNNQNKRKIAETIFKISKDYNLDIKTCATEIDLQDIGIRPGKCIDDNLISKIIGKRIHAKKDKYQRHLCRCVTSVDIGAYDTCRHNCLYCYANSNHKIVERNYKEHNPSSPLLFGELGKNDKIIDRKMSSFISG